MVGIWETVNSLETIILPLGARIELHLHQDFLAYEFGIGEGLRGLAERMTSNGFHVIKYPGVDGWKYVEISGKGDFRGLPKVRSSSPAKGSGGVRDSITIRAQNL